MRHHPSPPPRTHTHAHFSRTQSLATEQQRAAAEAAHWAHSQTQWAQERQSLLAELQSTSELRAQPSADEAALRRQVERLQRDSREAAEEAEGAAREAAALRTSLKAREHDLMVSVSTGFHAFSLC